MNAPKPPLPPKVQALVNASSVRFEQTLRGELGVVMANAVNMGRYVALYRQELRAFLDELGEIE